MVFIRADANSVIATGHIMRCMAIANQLQKQGETVTFLVADEYPVDMLNENGFSYIVLHTDWNDMESELLLLKELIQEYEVCVLFVDSYQVSGLYFTELSKTVKVIYLDDRNAFPYDVSEIINYSHYYRDFEYEKVYGASDVKLWLGCEYIPLREEFCEMEQKDISEYIQNVMITTGGTDRYHVSDLVLEMLSKQYPDIVFHMVVGRFFDNADRLKALAEERKNVKLYERIAKMSALMSECDIAISAGGTTLYELCAAGIPTICFSVADNQVQGIKAMKEQDIMLAAGDIRDGREIFGKRLVMSFERLQERKVRLAYSRRMQGLVDGKGAERIARIIKGQD